MSEKEQPLVVTDAELVRNDKEKAKERELTRLIHESGKVTISKVPLPEVPAHYQFAFSAHDLISNADAAIFMLLGGVPAYLLWADENKTEFYKGLRARAAEIAKSKNQKGGGNVNVIFQSASGPSPLAYPEVIDELDDEHDSDE